DNLLPPGEAPAQGNGSLEDGTMIVGDHSGDKTHERVELVITSVLQTSAGRMIFGRLEGAMPPPRRRRM
ncbi:MAG: hypothetical protein AB7N71_07960, partial [Phycisphaerae bacterium]